MFGHRKEGDAVARRLVDVRPRAVDRVTTHREQELVAVLAERLADESALPCRAKSSAGSSPRKSSASLQQVGLTAWSSDT
eukprot:7248469-Prymnesium_polylepis.1